MTRQMLARLQQIASYLHSHHVQAVVVGGGEIIVTSTWVDAGGNLGQEAVIITTWDQARAFLGY